MVKQQSVVLKEQPTKEPIRKVKGATAGAVAVGPIGAAIALPIIETLQQFEVLGYLSDASWQAIGMLIGTAVGAGAGAFLGGYYTWERAGVGETDKDN